MSDGSQNAEMPSSLIESHLAKLESGIRQLKIQYDMFLNGALPYEPFEDRDRIRDLVRLLGQAGMQRYADRYRYNSLRARFNSLTELWGRTVRNREEGRGPGMRRRDERRQAAHERVLATCRVDDVGDHEGLRQLHASFVEARRKAAPGRRTVPFDLFLQGIEKQAQSLRKRAGCTEVELRLVATDDGVQLKARPGRTG